MELELLIKCNSSYKNVRRFINVAQPEIIATWSGDYFHLHKGDNYMGGTKYLGSFLTITEGTFRIRNDWTEIKKRKDAAPTSTYISINELVRSFIDTQDIHLLTKIAKFTKKSITYPGGIRDCTEINRAALLLERYFQDIDPNNEHSIYGNWYCLACELFHILNAPYNIQ